MLEFSSIWGSAAKPGTNLVSSGLDRSLTDLCASSRAVLRAQIAAGAKMKNGRIGAKSTEKARSVVFPLRTRENRADCWLWCVPR